MEKTRQNLIKEINGKLTTIVPGYSTARYALMDLRGKEVKFITDEEDSVELHAVAVMNALDKNIYLLLMEKDQNGNEKYYWASTLRKDENNPTTEEIEKIHQAVMENDDKKRIRAYNPIEDLINHDPTKRILERINQSWDDYQKMINKNNS